MSNQNNNNKSGRKGRGAKVSKAFEKDLERDARDIRDGSRKEISKVGRDYLRAIVDTRNAKKVGVPTLMGGAPGSTAVEVYTNQIEVFTGTQGFGYIALNINHPEQVQYAGGPFRDGKVIQYTTNAFANTDLHTFGQPLRDGEQQIGWTQSDWFVTGLPNGPARYMQYRPVACTMTVFPDSSFSRQNGRIALLEPPNHTIMNNITPLSGTAVESAPRAHVIRATQTGAQSEKIVLNWHPKNRILGTINYNDWDFGSLPGPGTPLAVQIPMQDGIICFFADAGTQFHVEVTVMYELKGLSVPNVKPRLTNSRDMDLIFNTFDHKKVSGYVGKPEHVYESYLSKAWSIAKKSQDFISKHETELLNGAGIAMKALGGFL